MRICFVVVRVYKGRVPSANHSHFHSSILVLELETEMEYLLASIVIFSLTALATAAPASLRQETVCPLLSQKTGQFVKFSAAGKITADGHFGAQETNLYVQTIGDNLIRIESVKTDLDKPCFLTYENGMFKGGQPQNGNEIFEKVRVGERGSNMFALRVVNTQPSESASSSASGSGEVPEEAAEEAASEDCFIGFSSSNSEPKCYSSTKFAETTFVFIH